MEEIWKDIPNYEGLYQISNLGNVKSLNRLIFRKNIYYNLKEKLLKKSINKGYYFVILSKDTYKKKYLVHQLVAMAFLGHKPCGYKLVVNHINFNKLDNIIENLEIITQRENSNKKHIKSSSKYVGVSWHKRDKKWASNIFIDGKLIFLGNYNTEFEAYIVRENYIKNNYICL